MMTAQRPKIRCNGYSQYFTTRHQRDAHDCYVFSQELEPTPVSAYPSYRDILQKASERDPKTYAKYARFAENDPLGMDASNSYFRHWLKQGSHKHQAC